MTKLITRRTFVQGVAAAGTAALASPLIAAQQQGGPITVALVGCAHIHVPGFIDIIKKRNDVKVKSVWDHDVPRAERRARELSATMVRGVEDIWADPQVQAAIVCSETNRHRDLIIAGAKAGKHLFVEKPLGITGAESYEMAEAIEKAKVLFTTGYFFRAMPHHLFLKKQVEAGNFGKITRIRGSNCHSGSLGGWFDTEWRWMADPKIAGVGAFGDLGTHSLDIMMWLLGDVESGTADINVVTGRYGDCDESGEGLMKFKSGVAGTLAAGWVDIANPVSLIISGTEGHAAVIDDKLSFTSNRVKGKWELPPALPHPLDMFLNAVAGNGPAELVSPREAAARVAVMEALYQGARKRQWVNVAGGR